MLLFLVLLLVALWHWLGIPDFSERVQQISKWTTGIVVLVVVVYFVEQGSDPAQFAAHIPDGFVYAGDDFENEEGVQWAD